MTSGNYIFGALAAVALCVVTGTNPIAPLVDIVARGKRLTYSTVVDGVVQESVTDLAAQATAAVGRVVGQEALALALMVRAEEGSAGQLAKVCLCHVAYNQAGSLGWSVLELIQYHQTAARARHFGAQTSGRFASGRDCWESDLQAAEYAQTQRQRGEDPTAGATNFVDRGAFGVQEGTGSFSDLVDKWAADGKIPGTLPGTPSNLVFFWKGELPDSAEAVA